MSQQEPRGFTVVELILLIAIIGLLILVLTVTLNPSTRVKQARDAIRQNDVTTILSAIKLNQNDQNGALLPTIQALSVGQVSMIVDGTMTSGCDTQNALCEVSVTGSDHCVNLHALVEEEYLRSVPISPSSQEGLWDTGLMDGYHGTGYTLERAEDGTLLVRACESEQVREISVSQK